MNPSPSLQPIASKPLWQPSPERGAQAKITDFMRFAAQQSGQSFQNTGQLHAWSIAERAEFWSAVWDYSGVMGEKGNVWLENGEQMPGAQFFAQAKLNYAENLLRNKGSDTAVISISENARNVSLSHDQLRHDVAALAAHLRGMGLKSGDCVAAMVPNIAETLVCMLAVTSIGAVWSSCSPDFGVEGVLDRFKQVEPRVFIACDGTWYNGKTLSNAQKLPAIINGLSSVEQTIIIDHIGKGDELAASLSGALTYTGILSANSGAELEFTRLSFNHPLFVLFSSGTTGIPKCIVHGAGGTLLQHLKEHQLHCDIQAGDRVFYYTTCGWMMWNWLMSALASDATLVLYEGSPFAHKPDILWDIAEQQGVTLFGTSAKYIDACRKEGLVPHKTHSLKALKTITSTGSPLSMDGFSYIYEAVKQDVHLASISGGTDIVSCFVLGDPTKPVFAGEIQGAGLGMAVDVYDDAQKPLAHGKGELVCTKAFPAMPIGFMNDPDGRKYHAAYFERFENIWCHGDFAEWTEHGGLIIHGRSDATLNPGGVRIGTAEIYAQVEKIPEVLESICIGQQWDDDVRVVLFVRLREGVSLDDALVSTIKTQVRTGASPRHVPAKILAVSDIPRTKSGKIVELAVREVVHGRAVKNIEALANPDALALFANRVELQS